MAEPSSVTRQLALDLLARTDSGKVAWVAAPDTDAFEFVGSQAVVVVRSRDGDGRWPYLFELYTADRVLVDSMETGWDVVDEAGNEEARSWNDSLRDLYLAARDRALNLGGLRVSLLSDIDAAAGSSD